ATLENVS
ncbi:hypothetical protein IBK40_04150, partial [Escherichia coli]|nr:hypothetical protein [Escherichia coli]